MSKILIPENEVERLLRVILPSTNFTGRCFAVGGYVRDQFLGIDAKDLDIVVSETGGAEKVTRLIHNFFPMETTAPYNLGAYPIWQITFKANVILDLEEFSTASAIVEFADTMKESFPDENSRQRKTEPATLKEDIERRDFTVNMLLKDLSTGEFIDMTGVSKSDISKGVLRGHPDVSFDKILSDDPLRMIRLVRLQAKYGWSVPLSVIKTVKRNAERIQIVSAERIMAELTKVMKLGKLAQAIKFMGICGILEFVLPEVEAMKGVEQDEKWHGEGDVFKHTLAVLKNAPATIEGQLSALLHDVGKPSTQEIIGDAIHFRKHEDVGAEMAEAMLYRLKFDSETIKKVKLMVNSHMRVHNLNDSSDKAIRKFIREVGEEMVDAILDLAEADAKGSVPVNNDIPELRERVKNVKNSPVKITKKAVLNGMQIMEALNIKPGPKVGEATAFLIELEDEYAEKGLIFTEIDAISALLDRFK